MSDHNASKHHKLARGTVLLLCEAYCTFNAMDIGTCRSTHLLSWHLRILAEHPSAGQAPALLGSAAVDS